MPPSYSFRLFDLPPQVLDCIIDHLLITIDSEFMQFHTMDEVMKHFMSTSISSRQSSIFNQHYYLKYFYDMGFPEDLAEDYILDFETIWNGSLSINQRSMNDLGFFYYGIAHQYETDRTIQQNIVDSVNFTKCLAVLAKLTLVSKQGKRCINTLFEHVDYDLVTKNDNLYHRFMYGICNLDVFYGSLRK